ncbi:MAG: CotH kinase family protein [Bacteroidota bacterium]
MIIIRQPMKTSLFKKSLILSFFLLALNSFSQELSNELSTRSASAPVTLDSTKLPIVFINTNWQFIGDDPKIPIDFKIMDKGYNVMNKVTDPYNNYNGKAGIEKRGSISQLWPQNSYSIELRDAAGFELNMPLLGMPSEHDWVLYGPYDDQTFMKNAMSYQMAREMGHWSSRTKFCEVLKQEFAFTPSYHGVYLLTEKIKRDKNRLDISKLDIIDNTGDELTGGYIIAVDQNIWTGDSGFTTKKSPQVFVKYVYPKPDVITPQQVTYIQNYVDSVETVLLRPNFADPVNGYRKYMNVSSFIDYFIIIEMSKSIDAFKRSAYMHKDKDSKGGKLAAGPYWDFNSAWGKPKQCGFDDPSGWAYTMTCWVNSSYPVPFWWSRMLEDNAFKDELKCRWTTLRQTTLSTARIFQRIDSMANYVSGTGAHVRHFARWDFTETFQGQVDTMKLWISSRTAWMDANMPGNCVVGITDNNLLDNAFTVYPNPAKDHLNVAMNFNADENLSIQLVDMLGRTVITYPEENYSSGSHLLNIPLSDLSPGIYHLQFVSETSRATKKIVVTE